MTFQSIFGFYFTVNFLSRMGWPRKRGLFSVGTVYDSNVLEIAEQEMIEWSARIGAYQPTLALQMIATMFREHDWESDDSSSIMSVINESQNEWSGKLIASEFSAGSLDMELETLMISSENVWNELWNKKEDRSLKDVIQSSDFITSSKSVSSKIFISSKEIKLSLEKVCLESILWGLLNPQGVKAYFEKENQKFQNSMPIYKTAKLDVQVPSIEQILNVGEQIVRNYEKDVRPLSPVPRQLVEDIASFSSGTDFLKRILH